VWRAFLSGLDMSSTLNSFFGALVLNAGNKYIVDVLVHACRIDYHSIKPLEPMKASMLHGRTQLKSKEQSQAKEPPRLQAQPELRNRPLAHVRDKSLGKEAQQPRRAVKNAARKGRTASFSARLQQRNFDPLAPPFTKPATASFPTLNLFSLEGKTALVTGASSGLGREIAIGMAMARASVALIGRTLKPLLDISTDLAEKGYKSLAVRADISKSHEVQSAIKTVVDQFGKIDVLVNNAGTTWRSPITAFDEEQYDRVVNVNMKGTFLCLKYVGIEMLKRGGGSIINVGSSAGQNGMANSIAYCASKGGVAMLTKAAAVEWARLGIRVNAIMPGTFKTPLLEACMVQEANYAETIMRKHPIGRFGELEEIVGICIYLASDNSKFMTGGLIPIDGGLNAQ
jgi:NAD(P)-dependent dehydrogenase (short-subunit alcohol dehydrogenase family)